MLYHEHVGRMNSTIKVTSPCNSRAPSIMYVNIMMQGWCEVLKIGNGMGKDGKGIIMHGVGRVQLLNLSEWLCC